MMDAAKLAALAERAGKTDPALPFVAERTLHVDGDYAAYYFAGNDDTPILDAQRNLDAAIGKKQRLTGSGQYKLHLTADWSDKGKRFKIATVKPYQGQRDGGRKPRNWAALRAYMEMDPHKVLWDDREADDGISAASFDRGPKLTAIWSRDKDFHMIPGIHIGWKTDDIVKLRVGESLIAPGDGWGDYPEFGPQFFWLQMLMGDTADNIPGLPKIPLGKDGKLVDCGYARAKQWLAEATKDMLMHAIFGQSDHKAMAEATFDAYTRFYGPAEVHDRFVEQAALLWMRRVGDPLDFLMALPGTLATTNMLAACDRMMERIK